MSLSNRALGLLGLALVALLAALVSPGLVWVALAIDAIVLLAAVADARRTVVRVERVIHGSLYQGSPVDIELVVHARDARVRLRDPLAEEISEDAIVTTLDVRGVTTFAYRVTPRRRGGITLGPVTGLVLGRLGLVWRAGRWVEPAFVRVMPRVRFDGEAGIFLRAQLETRASVRVDRSRGHGGELHGLREYVPGDDVRAIHWLATARMRRPIVMDREWDRHQHAVLLLDCGRSMGSLADGAPKLDQALAALIALLRVAVLNDDRVTVVLFSDEIRRVVTVDGRTGWAGVFEALYAEHSDGKPSDYVGAAGWVAQNVRRRGFVVLFTSVGDAAGVETLAPALALLRRRHRTVLVDLEDPAVVEVLRRGPKDQAELCEMASAWMVRGRNEEMATRLRRAGVEVVRSSADGLMVRTVRRYLEVRAAG